MQTSPVHSASMRKRKAAESEFGDSGLGGTYSSPPAGLRDDDVSFIGGPVRPDYESTFDVSSLNLPRRLIPSRPFLQPAHDLGAYRPEALEVLRDGFCAMSVGMGPFPAVQVDDVAHVSLLRSSSDSRERSGGQIGKLPRFFWQG